MSKKQKTFILVFLFFLLFITVIDYGNNNNLRADSGWDSSYDSGGGWSSSGGSSHSWGGSSSSRSSRSSSRSSSSSNYTYSGTEWDAVSFFIAIGSMILFYSLIFLLIKTVVGISKDSSPDNKKQLSKYEEYMANYDNIIESLQNNTKVDTVEDEEIKELLPKETRDSLIDKLVAKFIAVQNSWMNFDYKQLRNLCSDELFNTYKAQLDALKIKNGQNIMSDFRPIVANITGLKEEDDLIIIKMFLKISFHDYVINTKTKKVIRSSKDRWFNNLYNLEYIIGNKDIERKCPNCGAIIENVTAGKCKYCGSHIVIPPKDYVLNKKNIIK